MGIFRKEVEVLDLTLMQKKGILKTQKTNHAPDIVDLTQNSVQSIGPSQVAPQQSSSPFDFLDLAASSASQSAPQLSPSQTPTDVEDLKVKLDNIEYKLERFVEKLEKFEEKISQLGIKNL